MLLPYLALFFFLVALILFLLVTRQKRKLGIPAGRVIYIDASQWGKVEKPFYDPELRLTGKPDYLVEHGNQVIPVEVKSRRAPQSPYDSHIYQLAAYCLLVEHAFGIRPSQGFIHYADRTFEIEYTHALEASIKGIIQEMQGHTTRSQLDRSHNNPGICMHCGYRFVCDQSLRI